VIEVACLCVLSVGVVILLLPLSVVGVVISLFELISRISMGTQRPEQVTCDNSYHMHECMKGSGWKTA